MSPGCSELNYVVSCDDKVCRRLSGRGDADGTRRAAMGEQIYRLLRGAGPAR